MKLRWTRRAEADLGDQCTHIAQDNAAFALRLGLEVFQAVEGLRDFPYRGRPGRVDGTRELVFPGLPWIAVYAVTDDSIVILRLLHGAQEYPS